MGTHQVGYHRNHRNAQVEVRKHSKRDMVEQWMDRDDDVWPCLLDEVPQPLAQERPVQMVGGAESLGRIRDVINLPVEARAALRHRAVEGDCLAKRKTPTLGEGINDADIHTTPWLAV